MNKTLIAIFLGAIIIFGVVYVYMQNMQKDVVINQEPKKTETEQKPVTTQVPTSTNTEAEKKENKEETVIGKSVEGNDITAYHFGTGDTELLFIGGIHGGYSWNTALVAYELMDYLKENPKAVPKNVKVTVIPVLNPDGLAKIVGKTVRFTVADVPSSEAETVPGRFNAHKVDLNRNFDCDWQSSGTWQKQTVSGGSKEFSEPESVAIKNYASDHTLSAVVVWYSALGGVFASNCHRGVLPETHTIVNLFSKASGYKAYDDFNFYEITGDMVNWFAKKNVPAMSILLTNHTDTEWSKNKAGITALLEHYAK
jgi:hypothetical protein